MIPPFDDFGLLPSGTHLATLDEIQRHFGSQSELRRVQMESIRWMVDLAVRAGAKRIVLNGSFVTDIIDPNDVDCVLLFVPGANRDRTAIKELLPFLDIALVNQKEFDRLVVDFFAGTRSGLAKGMIEVVP